MGDKANSTIRLEMSALLLLTLCVSTMGKTIYVDGDAAGANDGTSWENAYTFLQEALADADLAEKPVEIRVAQGIYRPNEGLMAIPEFDWRTTTFQLVNGVTLKGGYAGFGEQDANVRDIAAYQTILTGDLAGNDVDVNDSLRLPDDPNRAENSYHVVSGNLIEEAILDGFVIMSGNADGEAEDDYTKGGGFYCHSGSPVIRDCTFTQNTCLDYGAGVYLSGQCKAVIADCVITGNSTPEDGGGIFIKGNPGLGCTPLITRCIIKNNWAGDGSGGIRCDDYTEPTIKSCIIAGNASGDEGGGMSFKWTSWPHVENCTIVGNSSTNGGGIFCVETDVSMVNCILWANRADYGNQIAMKPSNWYITRLALSYCDLQGGREATYVIDGSELRWLPGNIDTNPFFVDPGYWDPNGTPEDISDDYWVNGDYHLKSQVGRYDPNTETWIIDDVTSPCIDAGDPNSDWTAELWPHGERINMGAYGGTSQASMSLSDAGKVLYIQWLGHASVKLWTEDAVVYVDPRNLSDSPHDATLVLVTHTHGDHYQPASIAKVSHPGTEFIAPPDVVQRYGSGQPIAPGQTIEVVGVPVTGVAAYNTNKPNHPKSRNWVGFIIELGSKRIYVAGDTDLTDEMKALEDIDVAILPAGGTYTMNAVEAAEATEYIKPELAIPYHWGDIVGTLADAQTFAELARCAVKIFTVGETISSDNWPEYSPLIAHWALDETDGGGAYDSAGDNDAFLVGDPVWQPTSGKIDGALQFDGIDDYVARAFVLNPAETTFSVFAWAKGGAPGQVIISQTAGVNWLCSDPSEGYLMTELRHVGGRAEEPPLLSQTLITDGAWHHVGFVWDGSDRILYVDDAEVARDTQVGLGSSEGGLYIGTGKNREPGSFFSGLIDDVRIYDEALSAEEVADLVP